jgi:hypothetical protein
MPSIARPASPGPSAGSSTGSSSASSDSLGEELLELVHQYRASDNVTQLHLRLAAWGEGATPETLMAAVEPFREVPEVAGPVYERVVAAQPTNARALVILANAYWLAGRGPAVVGELAERARTVDPLNRGAWHLWALSESNPRRRMDRWLRVSLQFPDDDLARANLADNAVSVADAEHDPAALQLALETYTGLRARATNPQQQAALDRALTTLREWHI